MSRPDPATAPTRRTLPEWEAELGRQVRALRTRAGLTQVELAERANVSVGTIRNLEAGVGSTLSTLIEVARALDRTEWLEMLAPPVRVSPLELLEARERADARDRR
jgi:transcriptional regulator with XRE-family HTH domain